MNKTITIDGSRIYDIPSLYEEINRVFMPNENWKLANSLDALNDMFYGGYGELNGNEEMNLVWKDFERNKKSLGLELTKDYYSDKLKYPSQYDMEFVKGKLEELDSGKGKTYFEIVLEIINKHKNIHLVPR